MDLLKHPLREVLPKERLASAQTRQEHDDEYQQRCKTIVERAKKTAGKYESFVNEVPKRPLSIVEKYR